MREWRKVRWIIAIIIVISLITTVSPLRNGAIRAVTPVISVLRKPIEGINATWRTIRAIPELSQENGVLQAKVTELTALAVRNQELAHENELLRKELALSSQANTNLLASQVVARSASVSQQTLQINKGTADGLSSGMAVVAQGYLVGRLDEVLSNTSRVRLITSSDSLLPVVLQNSRSVGLLRGGAEGLVLDEIPRDIAIAQDEAVVTAPVGDVVTSGLPVGTISRVISSNSDVFQVVRVRSPIDFSRLEIVFIVK